MPEHVSEDSSLAIFDGPEHRLGLARASYGLRRILVERVVVPRRGQNMAATIGLPFQVGVQLVVRLQHLGGKSARNGMIGVRNFDSEIVRRRVLAGAGPPVAARELLEFRPTRKGCGREVIKHQSLPAFHELQQGVIGSVAETQSRFAPVGVVEHDEVVGGESFRTGSAELFRYSHFEATGVL